MLRNSNENNNNVACAFCIMHQHIICLHNVFALFQHERAYIPFEMMNVYVNAIVPFLLLFVLLASQFAARSAFFFVDNNELTFF